MEEEQEGMTDRQFKAYLRSLMGNLEAVRDEPDPSRARELLDRTISTLRESLGD